MSLFSEPLNLVLEDRIVFGTLALDDDRIAAIEGEERSSAAEADFLIPGLIDIHTDNIEHHFQPRPGVQWPSTLGAVLAHDWQVLGAGITTVLDSLSLGDYDSRGVRTAMLDAAIGGLTEARAADLLRVDHYFHFRCELSDPALLDIALRHVDNPGLRLMSMMDHTPGQRQWHDVGLYREFRRKKNARVWSDEEFAAYIDERRAHQARHVPESRLAIAAAAAARSIHLASHDDTSLADIDEAVRLGIGISEFPTTLAAAEAARAAGMAIVMGAPNIVLGGSHSGNVGAAALADAGLLDILTSDYVPTSLLQAPFILAARGMPIPAAIRLVTAEPADALGFFDRGRIAPGLRADLVRLSLVGGVPVIRAIWVAGRRII